MSIGIGMAEEIQTVLAAIARYSDAERLYSLDCENAAADLVVERWQGWEALSVGYEWWIDALSIDAHLPLHELFGQRATLWMRAADGSPIARSGLIRDAACIGSDGGLARYRLCLAPWTWLLGQSRRSRVFQDKTVIEIVQAVFDGYAAKQAPLGGASVAAWQIADEVGAFLADVRPRSYCVQYRESDADFIARLLAEEGLCWRLEEANDAPAGHRVVLFADSGQAPQDAQAERDGAIRFHRSDATERADTIQAIGTRRGLESTALTLLSHDYKTVQAQSATTVLGDVDETAAPLELYDPSGAYAFASQHEAMHYAGLMAQAHETRRSMWFGQGTARSFRAGSWFALTEAPHAGDPPPELLLTTVQHAGVNNLPDAVREGVAQSLGIAPALDVAPTLASTTWQQVQARAAAVGYANAFTALPRAQPWRPVLIDGTGARLNPRPTAPGYQTGIVVGADGNTVAVGAQELHCDALGRVKVRFHFQRGHCQQQLDDSEATASCWLRVSQGYAGPGVGTQFLPRIGQEVLVAFVDGDIDRPLIAGALYNGQGEGACSASTARNAPERPAMDGRAGRSEADTVAPRMATTDASELFAHAGDHRPSAQANPLGGNAPAWHGMSPDADGHRNAAALLGIKSREFGGLGHNALVLDDSDGQLRLQLTTTQAATQLNLGHLIHQADNYRGSFRGEGFELRSDQWGAARAQRGLWVSAYAAQQVPLGDANNEDGPAGDHVAATALLKQAEHLGQVLSDIAGIHHTVKLAVHQGESKAHTSRLIDDQAPLKALLTSAKTTVSGGAFDQARSEAGERNANAGNGRIPHTGDALLGLSAPAGIGLVAGQSLHWSIGETLTIASGAASNVAVAGDLRLHAGQAIGWLAGAVESTPTTPHALSLVTAEGELHLQAQHDELKLQSRDQLQIVSANAEVELAAGKTVHLATSGGASITIEGGGIRIVCPGNITVHAGKKSFVGPTSLNLAFPTWPQSQRDAPCMENAVASNSAFVKVP